MELSISQIKLHDVNDITYENAHELIEAVRLTLLERPEKVMLDLSDVDMIDSSGLKALLQSSRICDEACVELQFSSVSDSVAHVIRMCGFASIFGMCNVNLGEVVKVSTVPDLPSTGWKIYEHQSTSDPSVISMLRKAVTNAATEAGATPEELCDIQIAVGEALTNAYRHGSPVKGESKIKLRCMTCSKAVVIEIEDEGAAFCPDSISIPDPKKLRDHGMGIYLMRQAMDVVQFDCHSPGNRVRMVKWLSDDSTG